MGNRNKTRGKSTVENPEKVSNQDEVTPPDDTVDSEPGRKRKEPVAQGRKRKSSSEGEYSSDEAVDEYSPHGTRKARGRGFKARAKRGPRKSVRISETVKIKYSEDEDSNGYDDLVQPSQTKKRNTARLPSGKKSGKVNSDSDDSGDENTEYTVDKVLGKRIEWMGKGTAMKRTVEYYISWVGYNKSCNTWEPEDNLNCAELISEFEATLESGEANGAASTPGKTDHSRSSPKSMVQPTTSGRAKKGRKARK